MKVKVKVKEVKVPNLIISILGKEETCLKVERHSTRRVHTSAGTLLKFRTTLQQNYILDLEVQGQGHENHVFGITLVIYVVDISNISHIAGYG